jgi:putative endonuclease
VTNKKEIGAWGEKIAAGWLAERGCEIVARNVRTPYGEIDIVAQEDDLTLFVEVKTRASKRLGPPEISITRKKQSHMLASAEYYAAQRGIDHWRIDVIAVEGNSGGAKPAITRFENAI